MSSYDDRRISELLAELAPAPPGWVDVAAEVPGARLVLGDVELHDMRGPRSKAELEAAVAAAGFKLSPALLEAVRRELERAGKA